MFIPPRRILFSGGGMKSVCYIGAVDLLEERGYLKGVEEYMGTSAGAFFAMCKVIGYTQKEVRDILLRFDFSMLYKPDVDSLFEYGTMFGIDDGSDVRRFLESVLRIRGFSATTTFREFYEQTGMKLRCFAADIQTITIREFSATTTPDDSVVHGVFASMAIPMYFKPVRDTATGNFLIDGGVINNVPLKFLSESEQINTLVLAFHQSVTDQIEIKTMTDYFWRILGCYYVDRYRELSDVNEQICYIRCKNYMPWDTTMTHEEKLDMVLEGRMAMAKFIDNIVGFLKKPVRRRSL
jgi:NTE family protein